MHTDREDFPISESSPGASVEESAVSAEGFVRHASFLGGSRLMTMLYEKIREAAATDLPVLLRGEPGTGKSLVATAIHSGSARSAGPFVSVECDDLTEVLLAAELFGEVAPHVPGEGRVVRPGSIAEARGGTLYLSEIDDLSPALQMRVLQFIRAQRAAGQPEEGRVRLVAGTASSLERVVEEGGFLEDLYREVTAFSIELPPLRDRRDDIPQLAEFLVERFAGMMGKAVHGIAGDAVETLLGHDWPGNVPELETAIEQAMLRCDGQTVEKRHLPSGMQRLASPAGRSVSLPARVEMLEKEMIRTALQAQSGKIVMAARELGITPRMIRYKMKKLGIDPLKYANRK